jgi:hypothetical protein
MEQKAFSDCEREGRKAFRDHGVTGILCHGYNRDTIERAGFVSGFNQERLSAAERSLNEAKAYHALTVRDAHIDRAWANKLSSAAGSPAQC